MLRKFVALCFACMLTVSVIGCAGTETETDGGDTATTATDGAEGGEEAADGEEDGEEG